MSEVSVIGSTTVVRGNLRGEGSVEILGQVEGDVEVTGDVTLGGEAQVQGNIRGAVVTVGGAVAGDITATEAVLLQASARVNGDLSAARIGIGDGALLRGSVATSTAPDIERRAGGRPRPAREAERPGQAREVRPLRNAPPRAPVAVRAEATAKPHAEPAPAPVAANKSVVVRASPSLARPAMKAPPPPVVPSPDRNSRVKKRARPK